MKARVLPMMIVAAALAAPARAVAGGALNQARAASSDPVSFDGGRVRPDGDLVRAGSGTDQRTAEQVAIDEQTKTHARADLAAATPGPDKEIEPPKPKERFKSDHIIMGAVVGLLVGSLRGMAGLAVGVLVGGLIGYGLSKLTA